MCGCVVSALGLEGGLNSAPTLGEGHTRAAAKRQLSSVCGLMPMCLCRCSEPPANVNVTKVKNLRLPLVSVIRIY